MSVAEESAKPAAGVSTSLILKYVGSLIALRILVKAGGFGEKVALAHYFELDSALDAFTAALSVPMMFMFTVSSMTGPTILPMFVRRLKAGDDRGAWSQWLAWVLAGFVLLVLIAAACFVFAERLATVLAPGFDTYRHDLCVSMLRVMIPLSVVMGLQPLFALVLNAQRRFAFSPASEFLAKAIAIGALFLFASRSGISAAVWGTAIGSVASLALCGWGMLPAWKRQGTHPRYTDPDFRVVLLLMLAPTLGAVSSRLGTIVENAAASTLTSGSVAALSFAWKIVNMPLLIIPLASGTVLLTLFAEMNQSGQHEHAARMLAAGVRVMLFIFLPLTVLTCVLSQPIIAFVYQRGAFDAQSTELVATILLWLAPAMCALSIEALITQHFYSRLDVWPPVIVGIAAVALRILLIYLFVSRWQLPGLAVSIVISRIAKVLVLMLLLGSRGRVSMKYVETREILQITLASVLCGAAALVVAQAVGPLLGGTTFHRGALLVAAGGTGAALYFGVAYLLGSRECHYVLNTVARRIPRRNPSA